MKGEKVMNHLGKRSLKYRIVRDFKTNYFIYILALICLSYYFIFCYAPMGGVLIAFKNYKPTRGIWGSQWVGLKYFEQIFSSYFIVRLFRNTLLINVYDLLFGFPAPIILALLFNELTSAKFRRVVQTVTYLPHFISQVVICGIIVTFLSGDGLVNQIITSLGKDPIIFLQNPRYFRAIYVGSGIWQNVGYGTILYLAALSNVDPQLLDAAAIDGCNRFMRVWHVTLPGITLQLSMLIAYRKR